MIRFATSADLPTLYEIGLQTPEIQVSSTEPFMDKDEFFDSINRKENFFLVLEEEGKSSRRAAIHSDGGEIRAFLMANTRDQDIGYMNHYACIVYIVVRPEYRSRGYAKLIYLEAEKILRQRGMTHLYTWANLDSGVIPFMEKQGFTKGHQYVWMDKKL